MEGEPSDTETGFSAPSPENASESDELHPPMAMRMDVLEDAKKFRILVDLPGCAMESMSVEVLEENIVAIAAERVSEPERWLIVLLKTGPMPERLNERDVMPPTGSFP
jgi:HSP20 family molecular chaperone IbpA